MKRILATLLLISLLLSLCACSNQKEIRFYYTRSEILYGHTDGVISSEIRDVSGHEGDLSYLLMLYLEGPHADYLSSPFPKGTALSQMEMQDGHMTIVLSEPFSQLQGLDLTLACSCIANTCFSISHCEAVTVQSDSTGVPAITLTRDSVALVDTETEP